MAAQLRVMKAASISPSSWKEKGQPLDLLALHVTLQLGLDLGAAEETDFLAGKVLGRSDSHGLIHKKALVVIEDRPRKAKARVGCIDEIRRSCGEQRDFAGLEGFQVRPARPGRARR